jgi:CIC family chloride channel protein
MVLLPGSLSRRVSNLHVPESSVLLALAFAVGLGTALGALGFRFLLESAKELFFGRTPLVLQSLVPVKHIWVALIPVAGGLIAGPIIAFFAHEAKGHGVPEVMQAVALQGGIIRPRVALIKALASAVCIGSGGSAGREGPIVQIGSAIGSTVGQVFRMNGERVKILVGCGAAAGISAVFNAPIAGALFSVEVILGDFGIATFAPVILSSVIASVVMRSVVGNAPAFRVPSYTLVSPYEIPIYIVLGVVCGVAAVLFIRSLYLTEDVFDDWKAPMWLKPAVGGLGVGIVGIFFPQTFADGYDTIHTMLSGSVVIWLAVALILLKMLATNLTLGSGNSGGIFAPSLFMGAAAGLSVGHIANHFFPIVTASPGAYALVGMGAVVAGTTHAPITAILILFEMTGDYRIILPVMVAVVFSTLVARRLCPDSIYTLKLRRRGIVLKQGRDVNVLARTQVKEVMSEKFRAIPETARLSEILRTVSQSADDHFPVVDAGGNFVGTIGYQDLRQLLTGQVVSELIIARDLAHVDIPAVEPNESLESALAKFGPQGREALPVIDAAATNRLVGLLRREAVTAFYNRKLLERLNE